MHKTHHPSWTGGGGPKGRGGCSITEIISPWFMDFSLRRIQGAFLRILNNHPGCGFAAAAPFFPYGCALTGLHSLPLVSRRGDCPCSPRTLILTPSKFNCLPTLTQPVFQRFRQ